MINTINLTSEEKHLIEQNKSFVLSEIIGTLIHQLKQPLNAIAISMISIETKVELDVINNTGLTKITNRVHESLQELSLDLDYFKEYFIPSNLIELDILYLTKDIVKLLEVQFSKYKITIELNYTSNEYYLQGYKDKYQQILFYILLNLKNYIKELQEKEDNQDYTIINMDLDINNDNKIQLIIKADIQNIKLKDDLVATKIILEKYFKGSLEITINATYLEYKLIF